MPDSRMPGFGRGTPGERRASLVEAGWLTSEEAASLVTGSGAIERLSEDVVGEQRFPLSLVPNFRINGKDLMVPMSTEESSVVAGTARVATLLRGGDGIRAVPGGRRLSAQVLVEGGDAAAWLSARREGLRAELDAGHPRLCAAGGGVEGIEVHSFNVGQVLLIDVGVGDAMGAHALDRMAEALGAIWEAENVDGRAVAAIVSNWPMGPIAMVEAEVPVEALARNGRSGPNVAEDIARLSQWAREDPRRRVTHLKGAMNGVLGVLAAFRQDLRAVAAAVAAGAWNDLEGVILPTWTVHRDLLHGRLALPVPCGIVGRGQDDPVLALLRRLGGIRCGADLEMVSLSVGLASNLCALQILVTEGIVSGHGRLHQGHATPGGE
ncbi:MAG: hypothetical protein ABIK09_18540 [Pseudomonadota bacterium]